MGGWMRRLLDLLPRGNTLDAEAFRTRHRLLCVVLAAHVPLLVVVGLTAGSGSVATAVAAAVPLLFAGAGWVLRDRRRAAASCVTVGLVGCSIALVALSHGSIEAHFHFFVIIGFIALYQDWVPFAWDVGLTVLSHGLGTALAADLIFNHPAAQASPWTWSAVHGAAVLAACVGLVIFWRITEDEQTARADLGRALLTTEVAHRRFTSEMLVNLARRNQSMLHRQLEIINRLEEEEQDADALADLFALDHLATRVRRNAESLLVLSGEQPPRLWSTPVPLGDVVRAAIAETEDLDRVTFAVDERLAVTGACVADLTHLLAELIENAVRFSPPDSTVGMRSRPHRRAEGGQVLTIEDWGIGMPADRLAEANALLAEPREIDVPVAQRLGFHVVGRLARRHGITVSLVATPGSGVTAVVVLPRVLLDGGQEVLPARVPSTMQGQLAGFAATADGVGAGVGVGVGAGLGTALGAAALDVGPRPTANRWSGWWEPPPAIPAPREPAQTSPSHRAPSTDRAPHPAPRAEAGGSAAAGDVGPSGLVRRVPQAGLSPQLRRSATDVTDVTDVTVPPPLPDPEAARALSRYQQARAAALAEEGE
jgi:signal transduction histidine kinase